VSTAEWTRIDAASGLASRRSFDRFMRWETSLPADLVEQIWQEPHALLAIGDRLQDKPRSTVVRVGHRDGPFVWKYHNWGTLYRTAKRSLARSTARKSWRDGHFLSAAGIPTPRPRAFIERRFGPFQRCSYVLSDYIPGTSLYRFMRFEQPSREMVRDLARQVAAIWQRLDEVCVWHNDFKTENLLVDPQGKIWLIDLERMRRYRHPGRMRQRQARDAGDFLHPRNWRSDPGAADVFRREILKTPAATATVAGPHGAHHPLRQAVSHENRPSQLVTVIIPCRNAAITIGACIESVRDMADEVLVVDGGSTDDTLRLARNCGGCRILEHPTLDGAALEEWAEAQAQHPWILRILPDEQLNSELGRQVQDAIAREPAEHGFRISRSMSFRGHRLSHGGFHDDSSIRLYRKGLARYEVRGGRVEVAMPSSKIGQLRARLVADSGFNVEQLLRQSVRLATRAAHEAQSQGLRPRRRTVLWRASWQFVRSYVLRSGWLDGWPGMHASCLSALSIYLRETMLWEMQQPAVLRRPLVRDHWRDLRVFDPNRADALPEPAIAGSIEENAGTPAHADLERMLPAA
jgi:hypothetical protein